MTNILTAAEAAAVLRVSSTDADMLNLLPLVDAAVNNATGHDWTADSSINPIAKAAARILLAQWYDNPAMSDVSETTSFGAIAALSQLEAIALRYKKFEGLTGAGAIALPGARVGDTVSTLIGLVGTSGDQSAKFETVISVADEIQQTSSDDLSGKFFRAYLVPLGAV